MAAVAEAVGRPAAAYLRQHITGLALQLLRIHDDVTKYMSICL